MAGGDLADIARALVRVFESPNVLDSNLEPANLVDVIDRHSAGLRQLAKAVSDLAVAVGSAQAKADPSSILTKELYRVDEVSKVTGLGRTKIYDEIAKKRIGVVHFGKSVRIPADELRAYVDRAKAEAGSSGGL